MLRCSHSRGVGVAQTGRDNCYIKIVAIVAN
jgi:hypothetical protein